MSLLSDQFASVSVLLYISTDTTTRLRKLNLNLNIKRVKQINTIKYIAFIYNINIGTSFILLKINHT